MSSRIFNLSPASSHGRLPHSLKLSQKYPNFKYSLRFHNGSSVPHWWNLVSVWLSSAVVSSTSAPIKLLLIKLPWRWKGNVLFSHKQPSDNRLLLDLFRIPMLFSSQRKAFTSPRQNHSNSPGLILVFAGFGKL